MKIFPLLCIIFINCNLVLSNYTFYEVVAFNDHERNLLYKIQATYEHIHFLNGVTNEAATIMDVIVDSCCTQEFEQRLSTYDIEYSCVTSKVLLPLNNVTNAQLQQYVSQSFLDWDEILLWVDNKLRDNSILTKTVIAKTFEHRDIFVLKISTEKIGNKMAVFVVAGEEGRDWLSSAILLNYINRILESTSSSEQLLKFYDLYFIPIINPDGFVYTKQNDRMWVKNRKLIQPTQICKNLQETVAVGVNIDKNWFSGKSDSNHPCKSIYSGSQPLSEEETQGLSYILNSIALKLLAFVNLRGFQNLIALPYSNNKVESINHNIVKEIMQHVSAVLKIEFNKTYPVGTTANHIYNFSGNMPDWVKRKLNIPIVFTAYMQQDNFLPKESHIAPLTEQFESLMNMTLCISKEIYGSLYNAQTINSSTSMLNIIASVICACKVGFL